MALENAAAAGQKVGLHSPRPLMHRAMGAQGERLSTLWKLPPNADIFDAIGQLEAMPEVAYAEPNYVITTQEVPNDSQFDELWGLDNTGQTGGTVDADIDAPEAWDIHTGSGSVVVGVIDSGVNYDHPDLAENIWVNTLELNGQKGFDDDGNGYIDDIHGYDFVNDDGDPKDDRGHGTHVAGTIGAMGNNGTGVAGVNWNVQIMPLKFLNRHGFRLLRQMPSGPSTTQRRCVTVASTWC